MKDHCDPARFPRQPASSVSSVLVTRQLEPEAPRRAAAAAAPLVDQLIGCGEEEPTARETPCAGSEAMACM